MDASRRPPFFFSGTERNMFMNTQSTRQNQAPAQTANQAATPQQAAVIALRKRCDADGVGLSHYILVDRKVAK